MLKRKPHGNYRLVVYPRLSVYGCAIHEDGPHICEQIERDIKRHIDDVGATFIEHDEVFADDGEEHETLFDALLSRCAPDFRPDIFELRYVRPSDHGVGSVSRYLTFFELVEEAFKNPWQASVYSGRKLTDEEQQFFDAVVQYSLSLSNIERMM